MNLALTWVHELLQSYRMMLNQQVVIRFPAWVIPLLGGLAGALTAILTR